MPVYVFPDLLDGLPPVLRQRMQGKSCLNFKTADAEAFKALAALTRKVFQRYRRQKFVK
jgi:hypothetical protein